ncbi:MAG: Dethiobiotin synthetase [Leptolyngbya sp.]|nr:Dethiobiotin synthetase [Leptolyngbya sp.]
MDFDTAYQFVLQQTLAPSDDPRETFITCLRQGRPPVPGQVTSLLLALKVLGEALRDEPALDRPLLRALLVLIDDSGSLYRQGITTGVLWPPLLADDLNRLRQAARSILTGPMA